eukprot:TRINITY_DN8594_c0_g1_i2.p1 TRINITY_DN8594_c0_g1~~TRINITY_DN8594_c0_g1_i2.p1  ORF type:complete len:188 (+),score=44.32 TRINITY_DN8594_c0_g1_i2:507-1070(+)
MESRLVDAVTQCQVFLPALAGKYRVKARLEFDSKNFDSFFQLVDKAWMLHVRGHTKGCEHLWWTKGIILRKLQHHAEERSTFESLISKGSPVYVSFGLFELGLFEDAYSRLKHTILESKQAMCLAQASRCLMRLGVVNEEARRVYRRLLVFGQGEYLESQVLSALELQFVKQVIGRLVVFQNNCIKH